MSICVLDSQVTVMYSRLISLSILSLHILNYIQHNIDRSSGLLYKITGTPQVNVKVNNVQRPDY